MEQVLNLQNELNIENEIEKITKEREFQEKIILHLNRTMFANLDDMLSRHFIVDKDIWSPTKFTFAIIDELLYTLEEIEEVQSSEIIKDRKHLYDRLRETESIINSFYFANLDEEIMNKDLRQVLDDARVSVRHTLYNGEILKQLNKRIKNSLNFYRTLL